MTTRNGARIGPATLANLRKQTSYRAPLEKTGEARLYMASLLGVIAVVAVGALVWGMR